MDQRRNIALAGVSRRTLIAVGIIALWLGGIAALARRELFRGEGDRLARAAFFVAPGAEYYEITDGPNAIGFGSSTIDTISTGISISDVVIIDLPVAGSVKRLAARMSATLTRTLRLRQFRYQIGGEFSPYLATGTVQGDSLLTLAIIADGRQVNTRRIPLAGPLLLPSMVPLVLALSEQPKVGQRYRYAVFDPLRDSASTVTLNVRAESLFVLADSAALDPVSQRWTAAHSDTVRAWRIEQEGSRLLTGWIDGRGRMVEATPRGGMVMRRTAYEIAHENWIHESHRDTLQAPPN